MTAAKALERLQDRIIDCERRIQGEAELLAIETRQFEALVVARHERTARAEAHLAAMRAELPLAEQMAAEEARVAAHRSAREELDRLQEVDRRETERLARMAELRDLVMGTAREDDRS